MMMAKRGLLLRNGLIGGAFVGALYGLCKTTGLLRDRRAAGGTHRRSVIPKTCSFIHDNYRMGSALTRLHTLLSVEPIADGLGAFERLCREINLLLGFERLVDTSSEKLPLHVNYTASLLATRANRILDEYVERDFRIPALGRDICECIESIQKLVGDTQTNIMHEFSLRITRLHHRAV
jgi:hypothetical protein